MVHGVWARQNGRMEGYAMMGRLSCGGGLNNAVAMIEHS